MGSNRKFKTGKCFDFKKEKEVDLEKFILATLTFTEHLNKSRMDHIKSNL